MLQVVVIRNEFTSEFRMDRTANHQMNPSRRLPGRTLTSERHGARRTMTAERGDLCIAATRRDATDRIPRKGSTRWRFTLLEFHFSYSDIFIGTSLLARNEEGRHSDNCLRCLNYGNRRGKLYANDINSRNRCFESLFLVAEILPRALFPFHSP